MSSTSIRARLLASVAAIQIVGAGLATYLVVVHERHQSYIAFDANLGEEAAVVRSLRSAAAGPESRRSGTRRHAPAVR